VINLLAAGLTGREIAERLVIAPSTAAKHIENVVGKLGGRSRTQAVAKAYRLRLIGELRNRAGDRERPADRPYDGSAAQDTAARGRSARSSSPPAARRSSSGAPPAAASSAPP